MLKGLSITRFSSKLLQKMSEVVNGSQSKRLKSTKWIGTHNGTFHCDEALACYMLKLLPEYHDAEIIRTRDQELLDRCDIVVDVGGVFDPHKFRFDHHQRSFQQSLQSIVPSTSFKTRLSSAGLVYAHFGHKVIRQILNLDEKTSSEGGLLNTLFTMCYETFMEELDANDNGVSQHDDKAKFLITSTLPQRVARLNPWWNAKEKNEDGAFSKAMNLAGGELVETLNYLYRCWWPARDIVKQAIEKRLEADESGEIIMFEQGGCPWKDHMFQLEQELKLKPIKYVVFPDERNGNWSITCVPIEINSYTSRSPLPESWRGLRDEQLSKLIGIENSVFCHATGFCGGHKTKEGVMKMVRAAMSKETH